MHLLDANVLIALGDPLHVHHERVQAWFHFVPSRPWATCPLTQNAFLRILGNPKYPESPGPPSVLLPILKRMCSMPGHQFWPDAISLCNVDGKIIPPSAGLTDFYLLMLAMHRKGKLATLDRRINASLLPSGAEAYDVLAES